MEDVRQPVHDNSHTVADYQERILQVLIHIQNHLDDELDLVTLAGVACFSPYHFHRIFRGMVGEGVGQHIRRLRLERAAHQLTFSDAQIIHIAFDAGYETHESFTRAFTAIFNRSPSAFRRRRAVRYPRVSSGIHYAPDAGAVLTLLPPRSEKMEVTIETFNTKHVAFVRHIGPYQQVGSAWGRLFAWAGPRGLVGPALEYFGLCYDDPDVTPIERLRYDACLVVAPSVQPDGDIGIQDVAGGSFATTIHAGPYTTLAQTYAALCGRWLPASGRELGTLPSVEYYLNDPRNTPEADLRTKVCLRLA